MFDPNSDPPTTTAMFKTFIALALPAMLTNLAGMTTNIVSLIFAGHMSDPTNLAAHALAFSSNSILVKSLLVGLNAAQETLTSQAFGANDYKLCGVYLNRGILILIAFFIPLAVVPSVFAEKLFLAMS